VCGNTHGRAEDLARGFSFICMPAGQESQLFEIPEIYVIGRADEILPDIDGGILQLANLSWNLSSHYSMVDFYRDTDGDFYLVSPESNDESIERVYLRCKFTRPLREHIDRSLGIFIKGE